jgi:hypothetical protein
MLGLSLVIEQIMASQEELSSMELLSYLVIIIAILSEYVYSFFTH